MRKILFSSALLILIVSGVFFWIRTRTSGSTSLASRLLTPSTSAPVTDQADTSATPFFELTIPYLRSRTYSSELTILERLDDAPTYQRSIAQFTSDGLKVRGLLTTPKTSMPTNGWPAIIFVHGYIPPNQYQTLSRYEAYVDYLAKSGFVVFKIDLRGHGQSEGEATGAYYSSDYVSDVLHAKSALQSVDSVDPTKIGLWGHSMAGNIVLRSIAVSNEFPAAVIWGGAVFSYQDWLAYGLHDNSYRPPQQADNRQARRRLLTETHGEFNPEDPFWKLVPATNFLSDRTTAIQLHHASNDDVVSVNYSRDLAASLSAQHKNYQFYEYPTGGHNINGGAFNLAMQRTVAWFQQWLTTPE